MFDKSDQSKFTVLQLGRAPEGEGVCGLWLLESNNWMDGILNKTVQEKVLASVLSKSPWNQGSLYQFMSIMPRPTSEVELDVHRGPKQEEESIPNIVPVWNLPP